MDDAVDLKHANDVNDNVSAVHSDENDADPKSVDLSMFKEKSAECGGNNKEKDI